jgi:hypothetical protein
VAAGGVFFAARVPRRKLGIFAIGAKLMHIAAAIGRSLPQPCRFAPPSPMSVARMYFSHHTIKKREVRRVFCDCQTNIQPSSNAAKQGQRHGPRAQLQRSRP